MPISRPASSRSRVSFYFNQTADDDSDSDDKSNFYVDSERGPSIMDVNSQFSLASERKKLSGQVWAHRIVSNIKKREMEEPNFKHLEEFEILTNSRPESRFSDRREQLPSTISSSPAPWSELEYTEPTPKAKPKSKKVLRVKSAPPQKQDYSKIHSKINTDRPKSVRTRSRPHVDDLCKKLYNLKYAEIDCPPETYITARPKSAINPALRPLNPEFKQHSAPKRPCSAINFSESVVLANCLYFRKVQNSIFIQKESKSQSSKDCGVDLLDPIIADYRQLKVISKPKKKVDKLSNIDSLAGGVFYVTTSGWQ